MKYLLALLLFLPFISFAQRDPDMGQGLFYQTDLYRFMLRKFAKKEGTMQPLALKYLKPNTKTIYVLKTADIDSLPSEVNGYAIKMADAETDLDMLHKEQKKGAVILYFTKILNKGINNDNLYDFWIVPAKVGKKEMEYEDAGCAIQFEYNMGTSKFEHRKTECK